ncbi:early nodulin-like protein 15 [Raphanus sativus]|uniref:Early nodulin-like protein 15 n=1 Tax=Raphanus sativus TaxID=3726 RepID=A0A9W3DQ73_RAPSA|nr:early nodulin-like protein 15 [Raphanus sativus]XP_056865869.1 early nodulin-like protein 15 [Raphanus sativus]KAJ4899119.1 early nodulin-like protein 15 [Raphanus sativus]KAJ4910201.1 early nodulin-like protein 15 [Raphanus sativus]
MSPSLLVTICLCIFFLSVNANEVTVGGKSGGWKIPPSSSYSFNEWGDKSRFKIGDFLVFSYEAGKDSVLQVTREAYEKCNTTSPKASYTADGNTKVKLDQPGPVYFISGTQGHCQKGQKLRLVVYIPHVSAFSPAPSPSDGPAVAPTSGAAKLISSFGVVGLVVGFWAFF